MKSFYKGQKVITTTDISFGAVLIPALTEGVVIQDGGSRIEVKLNWTEELITLAVYYTEIQDFSEYTLDSI